MSTADIQLSVVFGGQYSFEKLQSDYEQTNPLERDFIKNKPDLVNFEAETVTAETVIFEENATGAIAPLKMQYNPTEKTLEFGLKDGGVLQLGKEMFEEYTNIDTVALTNGMIVSTAAISGNRKGIKRTDFTSLTSIRSIVGMVTVASIGTNQSGRVTTKGVINDLNTNGWAEGSQLWGNPSVLGAWSGNKPSKPQYAVQIGQVVVSHATVGSVELNIAKDVKFSDLADVNGSTNLIDDTDTIPKRDADGIIREISVADIKADFKADTDLIYEPLLGFTPENTANKGQANGYASLGADGIVPSNQLPSFVDDVLEFANLAAFPVTGEQGKIYVALDTNKTYRWSGSAYIYITSGAVDSVAGKTGVVTLVKADVGLGNVDNTSDANKPVSTLQAAAIATKVGLTGDETVAGVKTFSSSPIVPNPTTATQALNKVTADGAYVGLTGAQNIAGVKTFTDKPIVPTPTGSTEAANKGYVDSAVVGAMPAASAALLPQLAYKTRVDTDSGLIKDLEKLTKLYIDVLELNKTAEVLFDGRSGYKLTTGKLSKLYNMAKAVDYTAGAGAEFYIGGFVAPNEGFKIKGLTGETGTKAVTGTAKSYLATESWTAGIMVMFNKLSATAQRIYLSAADYLLISSTAVSWVNAVGTVLTCTHSLKVGINNYIEFQYNNGAGLIKVNGVSITTTTTSQAVSVDRIQINQTTYNFDGTISHFIVLTGRISESASQQYYNFVRSLIPEIEGIAIGNQYWATSNYEGVVSGDGSVIPGVQNSDNVEKITNAADREFSSDTGFWTKDTGVTISDGAAIFTNTSSGSGLYKGNIIKNNTWYRVRYTISSITLGSVRVNIAGATGIIRSTDGVFEEHIKSGVSAGLFIYFNTVGTSSFSIDNVSVEEVGWSQSTALYDAVYAQTTGTAAQKELAALKAAAMWSYYNNDVNNGAIYGKLYNWYAVKLISLYPPQGWRVPSSADFTQLQTYLGGASVAGGKMKKEGLAYWASPNTGATNESGLSLIPNGFRSIVGVFTSQTTHSTAWGVDIAPVLVAPVIITFASDATISLASNDNKLQGFSLRLLRNSPVGQNERTITSTTIVSDIASTANSTQIPFGYSVASIRLKTTANLTNIKVELWNNYSNGLSPALVATLITGKTANNTTMVFPVLADCPSLLQDGTLRITATGANTFETIVEYNLQKNTF